jgi:chemotaxis protein MotB
MRPWSTPSRPRAEPGRGPRAAVALALLAALCLSCVSTESYEIVLKERDDLLTERTSLRERVRQLETDKRRLESSNESLTSERQSLIRDVEGLRTEQERLQADVQGLERHKKSLGEELARREGQLAEREALLQARSEELAALGAQLEARDAELDARVEELHARDQEIEQLRTAYQAFVADLEAEIADGQIVIDQLREGMLVNLPDATFFAPDSVELTLHGKLTLAKLAAQLRPLTHHVEVQGHTDDLPPPPALAQIYPSNWDVAAARAAAVVRQLVAHGVAPERLRAVSYGSSRPLASNDTEEDRARNRRIEVRLVPPTQGPARPLSASLAPPASPAPADAEPPLAPAR